MTGLLLVAVAVLLLVGVALLVPPWLFDRTGREARRIAQEQLLAQWQMRDVICQAQHQMREATRPHLP